MKNKLPILSVILTFLISAILFFSCTPDQSPEEAVKTILTFAAQGDNTALEQYAPFLAELPSEDKEKVIAALALYSENSYLDIKRQSLKSYTAFITGRAGEVPEGKILILTLEKSSDPSWTLSEKISYKQSIGFIPKAE